MIHQHGFDRIAQDLSTNAAVRIETQQEKCLRGEHEAERGHCEFILEDTLKTSHFLYTCKHCRCLYVEK